MSAGITQLVAKGVQDSHLTGDPEISFFRSHYKRHTNFAMFTEEQQKVGSISGGSIMTVRIDRTGDLLQGIYVTKTINGVGAPFADNAALDTKPEYSNIFDHVDLMIGGQVVDTWWPEFGQYMQPELLATQESQYNLTDTTLAPYSFIPISYWFSGNPQSFLPLVALQYHEVELRVVFSEKVNGITNSHGNINTTAGHNLHFWGRYISLDDEERKFMTQTTANLLITQIQRQPAHNTDLQEFSFTHPIKFLCARGKQTKPGGSGQVPVLDVSAYNSTNTSIVLQVNGTDLSRPMFSSPHFTQISKYYSSRYGQLAPRTTDKSVAGIATWTYQVFLYPFCLDTSSYQPTGTLNFSRVDNAAFRATPGGLSLVDDLYGVNYNILRIQNGMGGLVYAN